MKNMSKKQTLAIGLGIITVCLAVVVVWMFLNRSTSRAPTDEELAACAPYAVDWTALDETGKLTEKEIILSLCESVGDKVLGSNTYPCYTSETIGTYLYNFGEIGEIYTADELLYLSYTDADTHLVILAYDDDGLYELGVYHPENDTFFHELDGSVEVWEKFATGIQWG